MISREGPIIFCAAFYDTCSPTVMEALANGLSVNTTHSNGESGIITEGQGNFILSDPRDRKTWAEKIVILLNVGGGRGLQSPLAIGRILFH